MIAFDLDGTLAHYDGWKGSTNIGKPVPEMVKLVHTFLAAGKKVCIFTARVGTEDPKERLVVRRAVEQWSAEHIGVRLPVTATKSYDFEMIIDDRAIAVKPNEGKLAYFIQQFPAYNDLLPVQY